MAEPAFHLVLVSPEIGGNAGNVGRLCLNVGARLHLVHPLGFQTDEKAVRRAGLDYWKHVDVVEHESLQALDVWLNGGQGPPGAGIAGAVYPLSSHGSPVYTQIRFAPGDVVVFGCESVGLPPEWVAQRGGWRIPMVGPTRSLNLSNAAAVVGYEVLRQLNPELFAGGGP
ncbi:putative tRNA (cytidine(34)-2'-O)-methyltransferase [Deltaproteobacteria bacterium]|nr:putative tRNA (cytidine(34)-2'-O)-methyltransferase [Deltaproteobacteria bacterium]